MAEEANGDELRRLRDENRELLRREYESEIRREATNNVGYAPVSYRVTDLYRQLLNQLVWPLVAAGGIVAAFIIADKKLPNRTYGATPEIRVTPPPASNVAPIAQTPSAPPPARALVLSGIEAYTRTGDGSGRASISGDELLERVVEPLEKTGLVTSEAGKQILTATLDGGETLATDYFHERWAAEFTVDENKRRNGENAILPSVVCSPVFNAVPPPIRAIKRAPKARPLVGHHEPKLCLSPPL